MRAACAHVGNTKSEARNTKQIQNPKDQNPKLAQVDGFVLNIWISSFEFVSDFGFRDSDLVAAAGRVRSVPAPGGRFRPSGESRMSGTAITPIFHLIFHLIFLRLVGTGKEMK